jgi:serine/threonine protein kinase
MQAFPGSPVAVLFSGFRLDLRAAELRAEDGKTLRLPDQPFRIFRMLLEHAGEVVTREELRKCLWPNDTVVEFEHSISAAMNRLRQALGDSAEQPRFIETLARRGYRFMVPVQFEQPPVPPAGLSESVSAAASVAGRNSNATHYQVLERLGGGGMGVVYKAKDTRLNRPVALKFLPAELADDAAALERFRREAQAASALNHPNICTIYDVGELPLQLGDGYTAQRFIAMEFLDGQTLERRICGKPIPLQETLDLAIEIADALSAAHAEGIIHRDIKSANVFITKRGSAKILDFGLAKLTSQGAYDQTHSPYAPASSAPGITLLGKAMGTPTYMSPEQVRGEELDVRSDLFSFGVILYQMTTGVLPFRGDNSDAITGAILRRAPEAPSHLNPVIPARLEEIILKALEKDRRFRYQFAAEIRTDLQRLRREVVSEQPASRAGALRTQQAAGVWVRWKPWILSGSIATALGIAVAFVLRPEVFQPARELPLRHLTTAVGQPLPEHTAKPATQPVPRRPPKSLAQRRTVDLSQDFNATGFFTEGRSIHSDGLDGIGNAFPEEVLTAAKVWGGVPFSLGTANIPDAVADRTIALPAGTFDSLKMLAVGVNGDQESQIFRVTYSDGTESSFTQSVSDWYTPENYSGESDVAAAPYRVGNRGWKDERTFHLYGYSFALNARKKVKDFVLPANSGVKVFGLTLVRGSTADSSSAR